MAAPGGLGPQDVERERRELRHLSPLPPRQLHGLALVDPLELPHLLLPVDLRGKPGSVPALLPHEPPVLTGVLGLELTVPDEEGVARLGVGGDAVGTGEGRHERLGQDSATAPSPLGRLRHSLLLERVDDLNDLPREQLPRPEEAAVVRIELDDRARQRHGVARDEHRGLGALDGPGVRIVVEAAASVHLGDKYSSVRGDACFLITDTPSLLLGLWNISSSWNCRPADADWNLESPFTSPSRTSSRRRLGRPGRAPPRGNSVLFYAPLSTLSPQANRKVC
mmetsp:Transcript_34699/g.79160  ORF Transcript_34699/g.79160 Transcript_34699/m.79160 type:complete len:280 (-) Transcript_34699:93-932(-)